MKKTVIALITLLILIVLILLFKDNIQKLFFTPTSSNLNQGINSEVITSEQRKDIEIVVQDLNIPWEIAFLSNDEYLVTQRTGNLLNVNKDAKQAQEIEGVEHTGEGGLLGLALHPDFKNNKLIYLYLTYKSGEGLTNRVEQYKLDNNKLTNKKIILDFIKGSSVHDGGRIKFGPDGFLYITTGDAGEEKLAQDKNSLNGKILRIKDDGSIPLDNPFNNPVYSYGHRNPQGLTWDNKGNLWATEHGPSGLQTGYDELNLIEKGGNYGWPDVFGDQKKESTIAPIVQSGGNETWAPSGALFYNENIFFVGLRGESIYRVKLKDNKVVSITANFSKEFGRLRAISLGPDNYFYILTNNTDGRGFPKENDDKIIRINPKLLLDNNE